MRFLKILITLSIVTLSSYSYAQCGGPVPMWCDADGNFDVDIDDIEAISMAKGTVALEPVDMRDIDDDGTITVLDARQCITHCTLPGCAKPCSREADEDSRVSTAQALVTLNASNYLSRIDYWAEDIVYKEPVWTNTGRQELLDYLSAVFSGSAYGYPDDRQVVIKNELYETDKDGAMTYMATVEWSGTFGTEYFAQTGMSILKFRPGEGCPSYHRDYSTEGDTWWNIPVEKGAIVSFRNMYISIFDLAGRCFDGDRDGYTKYESSTGCPQTGLDCNDFDPEIHPGATEWPGNGIDEDCDPLTPTGSADPGLQIYQ